MFKVDIARTLDRYPFRWYDWVYPTNDGATGSTDVVSIIDAMSFVTAKNDSIKIFCPKFHLSISSSQPLVKRHEIRKPGAIVGSSCLEAR